jgi:DNA-directed RNA polymerase specialized sigma subunit
MLFRQILRATGKTKEGKELILNTLNKYKGKLEQREYSILELTYYKRLPALEAGSELGLSSSHYQHVLNNALGKLEVLVEDCIIREMTKMI